MSPDDMRDRMAGGSVLPTSSDIAPADLKSPVVQPDSTKDGGTLETLAANQGMVIAPDAETPEQHYRTGLGRVRPLGWIIAVLILLTGGGLALGSLLGHGSNNKSNSGASTNVNLNGLAGPLTADTVNKTLSINFNTLVNKQLTSVGTVLVQNQQTDGFKVQNAAGGNLLVADTANGKVGIGAAPAAAGATLQVNGNVSVNGQLLSSAGAYSLSGQGLSIGGVLVCTSAGCKPDVAIPSTSQFATLAGNNTFSGINKFTAAGNVFVGDGSGLSALNAGNITSGTLSDNRLSANVALRNANNTFSGANTFTSQLQASGGVDASNYSVGGVPGTSLACGSNDVIENGTVSGGIITGGTCVFIPGATTPSFQDVYNASNPALITLSSANGPVQIQDAASPIGVNLFEVASNGGGTTYFAVNSNGIDVSGNVNTNGQYQVNGSQISSSNLSDSANLAKLNGTQTFTGANTFNNAGNSFAGDGSGLTNVNAAELNGQAGSYYTNASNINAGTLSDSRLSANVTLAGNTFNGANELVQLTAGGILPILNGSNLNNLNASNISSGTLDDARLSSNVTLAGNTFNGANELVQLDGSGNLPALDASALLDLDASNISIGTISDARLSTNVTLAGNTFNGPNQLVQLDAFGDLPVLNGQNLNSLNASNVSNGTLADARLSNNVALLNANQTFNGNNVFQLSTTGLAVQDAASPLGTDLFEVTDNSGATKYFTVSATGAKINGNDVCTTAGNCTGTGGGVSTGGGTTGQLAKFTGSQVIGDSIISDNGSTASVAGGLNVTGTLGVNTITPTATLTIGTPTQTLVLQGDSSTKLTATAGGFTNSLVFAVPAVSNHSITVPNANGTVAVSASGPLSLDAAGNLTCPSCLTTNGTGGGSGVSSVNSITGDITLAGTPHQVIITPNSSTLTFSLPQDIDTTSSPEFSDINITGQYEVNGSQISSSNLSDSANLAKLNATQTFTGANTFNNASNSFTGNGSGLTSLNAGNISSGTLNDSRLSTNVPLKNAANTFTGTNSFNGNVTVQSATDNAAAFQIQNNAGTSNLFVADTLDSKIGIGLAPSASGAALQVSGTVNATTGYSVNGTAGLASLSCGATQLLQNASVLGGIVTSGSCVTPASITTPTFQEVYDASVASPQITLDSSPGAGGLVIQDAATPVGGNLFAVQSNGGSDTYLAVTSSGVSVAGNVNISGQYQVGGSQISTSNLSDAANIALLNAAQTFTGANTFNSASNSFTGNGSGLTSLNASNVSSGTLSDSRLSSNVALLNASQTFSGNNTFTGDNSVHLNTTAFNIQDNVSPLGTDLFEITDSTGATKYFTVSATALQFNGKDVCTTAGNCVGTSGGAIGGSGTAGTIPVFTGSGYTIGNSNLSQSGTTTTVSGTLAVNTISPTATLTVGVSSQTLTLQGDGSTSLSATSSGVTNSLVFAAPTVSNKTITIPDASGTVAVSASGPLSLDAAGNLTCPSCLTTDGTGGGSGVSSVNSLTGDITLAGTAHQVIITPSGNTLTFSTPQDIDTTSSPEFADINVTGQYEVNGSQISSANLSDSSNLAKLDATQTFTGANTFNNASNSFTGNGSGLTSLNASNVSSGTLSDARLTTNVPLKNAANTFTAANTIKVTSTAAFQVQNATTSDAVLTADTSDGKVILGAAGASGLTGLAQFNYSGSTGSISLTALDPGSTNYTLSLPAENGTLCSTGSICAGYASSASVAAKLNKNAADTSSASLLGNLYAFSNTNTGAAGVLSLNNSGTNSTLSVNSSANPTSGQALIVANNTNATPSGNLLDLQNNSSSKFSVDASGNVTASGNINIASGQQYQINGSQISSSNLSDSANLAKLNATQTFTGANTFNNASNSFTGNGSGLASLNASNVSSGTLNDSRLSTNVPLKNAANTFTNTNAVQVTSATAFQVQNASAADTMLTVDASARGAGGGNIVKIGNSTGTDGNTTILVVDSATAAPTSNLGALNGGLFYNSTTGHLSVIEGGVVKELCNKTDLGCGSSVSPTLTQVYGYGAGQSDETIGLDSTRLGVLIRDNSAPIGGTLFGVQNSTGGTKYLDVTASGISVAGNVNITGQYQINGSQISSSNLSDSSNLAKLNATQTFTGANTFNNASNSFTGNGSGLTSLNASNISSGTLNDLRLSANVPLLNAANTFTNSNSFQGAITQQVTSAAAFQLQSAGGSELLMSANTNTRTSVTAGNIIKIGNSTGSDVNTTILVLDSAAGAPSTNLSSLNGGLFYNSATGHIQIVENGQVKTVCNTTDLGCGSVATTTLAQAYANGSGATDQTLALATANGGGLILRDAATTVGNLFTIQNNAQNVNYFNVTSSGITTSGTITASGNINTTGQYQVNGTQISSANLSDSANLAKLNGNQTFSANNAFSSQLNVSGSLATPMGTDFATTGVSNDVNFGNVSFVRLTGTSAQTITGIAGGRDGYILTIVNAAGQAAVLSNNSASSVSTNRITTGSGADFSLPPGASTTLIYDAGTDLWRMASSGTGISAVGTLDAQTPSANGAVIVGNSIYLQSANGPSNVPGLVNGTTQTFAGAKTFSGLITGNAGLSASGGAISLAGNAASQLTTSSGALTITSAAAAIWSTSAGNLTLQAGSGTVSLGSSTKLTASGALSVNSGGANALSIDTGGAAGLNLGTSNTNAITIGNVTNNSSVTINSGTGTIAIGTGAQARAINIGTGGAAQSVTLGSVNGTSTTNINAGSGGIGLGANTTVGNDKNFTANGNATFAANTNAAATFQIQSSGSAETLLSANTLTRTSGVAGNIIKIGNSTGTDTNTTILVLDGSTAAPTTNLSSLNGGLFYNSTTGHIQIVENGQVKTVCNQTDQACGSGGGSTTTLAQAYTNGSAAVDQTLNLTSSDGGGVVIKDAATTVGNLFTVQNNAATSNYLNVTNAGVQSDIGFTAGKAGSTTGVIKFANATNTNTVTLQAPSGASAPAGNLVFTLPNADAAGGSCLQTDGSGNLSFGNCSGVGAGGNANRSLSNLNATTAINSSLVPGSSYNNAIDLGSSAYVWRNLYISNISTAAASDLLLTPTTGVAKLDTASTNNELRVYENAASPVNYTSIKNNSITNTSGNITLDAAGGTVILGTNTGTLQKVGTGFTFDLNNASNSTFTLTNSGGGVASLSVEGGVNIGSGQTYSVNGVGGATTTCSGGNILQNATVVGGIITGGTCAANGSTPNFQTVYTASATSPQITLDSSHGGLVLQDASTPIGASLFTVESNGGSNKYLDVTSNGISVAGNAYVSNSYSFTGNTSAGLTSSSGNVELYAANGSNKEVQLLVNGAFDSRGLRVAQHSSDVRVYVQGSTSINGSSVNFDVDEGAITQRNVRNVVGFTQVSNSGQTADMVQMQDSTGAVLQRTDYAGDLSNNGNISTPSGGVGNYGNLLTYSEQFDNAAWVTSNVTVTANDAGSNPAPDGTTTADRLDSGAVGPDSIQQTYASAGNNTYTFSVWLKSNSGTVPIAVQINSNGTPSSGASVSGNATTTWQRFVVTQAFTSGVTTVTPRISISSISSTVVAWGAQLVQGSTAGVYTRTVGGNQAVTNGLISNGTGLIQTSTNSTTAFQVQNATGSQMLNVDSTNARIGVDVTYTAMSTPTGLSVGAATSGGSLTASTTYYYKVTAIDSAGGETTPSTEASGATTATNLTLPVTWTAVTGASGYKVYRSSAAGAEGYLTTVLTNSFTDSGQFNTFTDTPPATSTAYTSTNNSSSSLQLSIGGVGTPTGQVYVSGVVPTNYVGWTKEGLSNPGGLFVQGKYAYVTDSSANALDVFDVSNPRMPKKVGSVSGITGGGTINIQGHYAYITSRFNHIYIVDISNPASPSLTYSSSFNLGNSFSSYVQGRYLYVPDGGLLRIYDISNPAAPVQISVKATTYSTTQGVYVSGSYAYVTSNNGSVGALDIFNISNPFNPTLVGTDSSGMALPWQVRVVDRYAYIADQNTPGLVIVDVSNPANPTTLTTGVLPGDRNISVQGHYAFTDGISNTLKVSDISNPAKPVQLGTVSAGLSSPAAVYVSGRYAYVTDSGNKALVIYDLGGTYTQQLEAGGAEFGTLSVDSNANFAGDASVQGGFSVGGGLQVAGNTGLSGGLNVQGGTLLGGGSNLLSTPAAPTVTPQGTAGTSNYSYAVTALNAYGGETPASPAGSTATGNATLSATNYNQVSWSAVTGASAYRIYRTVAGGTSPTTTGYIGSTSSTTFNDTGLAGDSSTAPTINTTGQLTVKGSALFANITNSTTAFQIQNAAATSVFDVDTTNGRIGIGTTAPGYALDVESGVLNVTSSGSAIRVSDSGTPNVVQFSVSSTGVVTGSSFTGGGTTYASSINTGSNLNFGITLANNSGSVSTNGNIYAQAKLGAGITAAPPNVLSINNLTTADIAAQAAISTGGVNNKGLVIQGVASQSANLLELQDSTGKVRDQVASNGTLTVYPGGNTNGLQILNDAQSVGAFLNIDRFGINSSSALNNAIVTIQGYGNPADPMLLVKANSSQTGNMLQLQDSSNNIQSGFDGGGQLFLGRASALTGSIKLYNAGGSGNIQIAAANPGSSSYTITVPAENGTLCTTAASAACTSVYGAGSGSTTTLAQAYTNGSSAANQTLALSSADGGGLIIQDASTTVGNLLTVQNNAQNVNYFNVTNAGISTTNVSVQSGGYISIAGGNTASRPASPTGGTVYYDTTTHRLIVYSSGKNGGAGGWQAAPRTATEIVAASNSTQAEKDAADYVASGTNDQNTINSALTALPSGGGTVYLMEGTYTISGSISVPNNTTLAGAGASTLITIPNAQNGSYNVITNTDQTTGTRVYVQNLRIDGNKSNQTSGVINGIQVVNMGGGSGSTARDGAKINNVVVENLFGGIGIDLSSSNNSSVSGSTALNNTGGIAGESGGAADNNIFTDNLAQGNSSWGFFSRHPDGSTFSGNTSQGNGGDGFFIEDSNATYTGNNSIGNTGDGFDMNSGGNNVVSGNVAKGNTSGGISLIGTMNNNLISGNKINDNGGSTANNGISISNGNKNSIIGNDITDTTCTSTCTAISISAGVTNTYLSTNHFLGDGTHAASINDLGTNTIYANQQKSESGDAAFRVGADTTTAFQVQNATGSQLLNVDSTNARIGVDVTYTAMSAPTQNTPTTSTTGGTLAATTYYYKITAIDSAGGETTPSAEKSITTTGSTSTVILSWLPVTGASGYKVYRGTTALGGSGSEVYLTTTLGTVNGSNLNYTDTGSLTAGTATPPATTTAYTSTNNSAGSLQLSVGGEGTPTGQVYVSGTQPVDVTNGGIALPGGPNSIFVQGHYAYVVTYKSSGGNSRLQVFDISNPAAPYDLTNGGVSTGAASNPVGVSVQGHYAYVVTNSGKLLVYDVTNPTSPTDVTGGGVSTISTPNWVYVTGTYAYVVGGSQLQIFSISNPAVPKAISTISSSGNTLDSVMVQGRYAYVGSTTTDSLVIFDISNPYNPAQVGVSTYGLSAGSQKVYVQGRYAYLTSANTQTLDIIDVSNPANPVGVGGALLGGVNPNPNVVFVQGRYAYVTTISRFDVVDISNPAKPFVTSYLATSNSTGAVYVSGRYAYVTDSGSYLHVFDIGGTYTQQLEAGGAEFGTLSVDSNSIFAGDVGIQGGTSIGQSLQVNGNIGTGGNMAVQGTGSINVTYSIMSAPGGMTATACSASCPTGSLTNGTTYYYKVTAVDSAGGETTPSSEASAAATATQVINTSWTAVTGASGYKVYRSTTSGSEVYLTTVLSNSFVDAGSITAGTATPPPTASAKISADNGAGALQLTIGGVGTPTGQVYVSGKIPSAALGSVAVSGACNAVVQGNFVYTAGSSNQLKVYDVANPAAPVLVGTVSTNSNPLGCPAMQITGNYLFIENYATATQIFDISNPSSPAVVGTIPISAGYIKVQGRYAYLTNSSGGILYIYDISNIGSPKLVSNTSLAGTSIHFITVADNYLYIDSGSNMLIYNISNPSAPALASTTSLGATAVFSVAVSGRYVYAESTTGGGSYTLKIYDISNPSSPVLTGSVNLSSGVNGSVQVAARYAYVTSSSSFYTIDISNPAQPVIVGTTATGGSLFGINGRYAYTIGSTLQTYDIGGTYSQSLESGSAVTGALTVNNNSSFLGSASFASGLQATGGADFNGDVGISSSLNVQGGTLLGGGSNLLSAPTGTPTVTPTGGTGTQRWDYVITAVNAYGGESIASATGTTSTGVTTLSGTTYNAISWSAVSGATSYKVYRTYATGGTPSSTGLIGTTTSTSFNDTGLNGSGGTAPIINTTGQLTVAGSALFANTTNSTTAFQVQNAAATSVFDVDTTNGRVGIGTNTPGSLLSLMGTSNPQLSIAYDATHSSSIGVGSSGQLILTNGSAANSSVQFTSTGGLILAAANGQDISLQNNGSTKWTLPGGTSNFQSNNTSGILLSGGTPSGTVPVIIPNRSDTTAGIGASSVGAVSIITSSTNRLDVSGTGIINLTPSGTSNTGVTVKPGTDSTAAFQVQDAGGSSLLSADTANMRLGVNVTYASMSAPTGATAATQGAGPTPAVTPTGGSSNGKTWGYEIVAVRSGQQWSIASAQGTTAVGYTTLTSTAKNQITWSSVSGATSYQIYRTAVASGGSPSTTGLIGASTSTTFYDTGLAGNGDTPPGNKTVLGANTTYYYKITAFDGAGGETTPSSEISASSGTTEIINLSWTAVPGAEGYNIYRGSTSGTETYLGTSSANSYVDGLISSTTGVNTPPGTSTAYTAASNANSSLQLAIGGNGTPTGQLYVSGTIPTAPVGSYSGSAAAGSTNTPYWVAAQGDYIFTAAHGGALAVFDASNPQNLRKIGSKTVFNGPNSVAVSGHYAYVVTGGSGCTAAACQLAIVDISNPGSPQTAVSVSLGASTYPESIAISGRYAYITYDGTNQLGIWDISNPLNPVNIDNVATQGTRPNDVFIQGRYAFLSDGGGDVEAVDISNPASASPVYGSLITTSAGGAAESLYVQGAYAYVANSDGKFEIYDYNDVTAPVLVASVSTSETVTASVWVQGRYAYVADHSTPGAVDVFDISKPASPSLVGSIPASNPLNITVQGRYLYSVSDNGNVLQAFDVGGAYIQQVESGGTVTGSLQVSSNGQFSGDVNIQGSTTIGQSLQVGGNIGVNGQVLFQNAANSTTAFQVQDAGGVSLLAVDTTNRIITISGDATTFANLTLSNAHFKITQTNPPTVGTISSCGTSPSVTFTSGDTDNAGSFYLTSGSTTTGTCSVQVNFNKSFGAAPKSVIMQVTQSIGSATTSVTPIVTATSASSFTFQLSQTDTASTVYAFYYWVIE